MFEDPPYQTIHPPGKFPTLSPMRPVLLLAALLSACATAPDAAAPAPGGRVVEVRRSFTCPNPASRGLITVTRDGKAERVVFEGLEYELGKTKYARDTMSLPLKDSADLFDLVSASGWQNIPERSGEIDLKKSPSCADCCSGAVMIKTTEGQRSLTYASDRKPEKLEALIKGMDAILARRAWERAP